MSVGMLRAHEFLSVLLLPERLVALGIGTEGILKFLALDDIERSQNR
jgi:hypothetical protein